uniref:protein-tyrosine-phosphatase n=1 Tax=Sarcophilus harrisii TaxID=9305 RepID=A0A7N4NS37_SARHA
GQVPLPEPRDQIGVSGGVASFVCQATGDPKPRVTWNKKGKKVNSQRFETIEFDESAGAVLRIQPLRTPRDENVYECVAQNPIGEITVHAKLTVLREDQLPPGFPNIDMGPQLKVVERTKTATMLCAASGNPDPEITWFKDFLPVDPSTSNGRIKQLRSESTPIRGALQIESSEETDQGKYECVANNSAGVRYSPPANLYVRGRERVVPTLRAQPLPRSPPPRTLRVLPGSRRPEREIHRWGWGAQGQQGRAPARRVELESVSGADRRSCLAFFTLEVSLFYFREQAKNALPKAPGTPVVTENTATSITITWDSGNPDPVSYYVIEYKSKSQDGPYQIKEDITTTRYSIGGLSPNSEYEIWVSAVNTIGQGPPSESVVTRTGEQAPASAPRNVQGRMLSATTMIIQWEEPVEPNGLIRGYRVYYTMEPDHPVGNWQKHNVDDSLLTTVGSLLEDETYTVRVLAFTSVGDGPLSDPIQVKTQQGVPGQPMNFRAEAKSETSISLTWSAPRQESIVMYELLYREGDHGKEVGKNFGPTTWFVVEDLKPNTEYTFRLAARSAQGLGAFTSEVRQRTLQSKPSAPPQDVKCVSTRSTAILVSWRPPPAESQNGDLAGYSVRYRALDSEDPHPREVKQIPPSTTQILLESLEKWTEYRITAVAHTAVGPGPESSPIIIRTDEDVPSAPPRKVEVEVLNSTAIKVLWRSPVPSRQHGQIRGYQVHYVRMENGEAKGLPQIKDVMLADAQWETDDTAEYEMVIDKLQPETSYSVTVAAYTMKGDGARSKPKLVVTKGTVLGKPSLSIHRSLDNSLQVRWEPAPGSEGQVLGYRLQFGRKDVSPLATLEFPASEDQYTATSIHKGATYVFRLAAKSRAGFGEETAQELSIPEDVPQGYPHILEAGNVSAASVQFRWLPPVPAERNGAIVKYTVAFREAGSAGPPVETELPASPENSFTLHGLKPNTAYDVKIRAHTSQGPGPYSPTVRYRTFLPDQVSPKNFKVKMVMKTSVLLSWEFPENYNSHTPYKIQYNGLNIDVDGRTTKKLITNLKPSTFYNFVLTNRGNSMGGLQQTVTAWTAFNMLSSKPAIAHKPEADGRVLVQLPDGQSPVPVQSYFIVVVPLRKTRGGQFLNPPASPEDMDLEELIQDISRLHRRSLRHSRQLDSPKPYIAARFYSLPSRFELGDQRHYSGFDNKGLEAGQRYVFFVLAVLQKTEPTFAASPFSDPIQLDNPDPQPIIDGEEGLIWVIGPVLAVVFIICIVIAILLYKKTHIVEPPLTPHRPHFIHHLGRAGGCPGPPTGRDHAPSPPPPGGSALPPGMLSHPPIPITEMAEHTEHLKANDNLKLSQEYESIDPGQQFTWEHSNLEVNKPKNRYANVIAYDHSRVILLPMEGIVGSDYINANYIDGYRKQNAYIATQGPLPETFGDFWRMVWEQRSATVVMMTKLEEKSRIKCDQYWPGRGTETYGVIQVTLLDTIELATFCVRTFSLHKNGSSEKREVRQFQFTAWPDHGVPEYPTPFLAFLRRVKTCNPPDAGPIVVHCSAGVGRTGCFIVIDAMLERIKPEKTVDIYGHVTLMRSQRNYMVQTEDQYSFIHDALLEAVACGNTEVPARNLYSYIQKLAQVETGEHVTGMELEFKVRDGAGPTPRASSNLPCNKFKNRLVNIMPYESTRVCLQPIRGVEGSDYINASFIDGYRQQKAYIATQGPLAETTEDFWRMLWENNSTIVVMLTKLREMGRVSGSGCPPPPRASLPQLSLADMWSPSRALTTGPSPPQDGQSRTVRQFQFTDWPEQGVPKSGEGFIDFIGQVHKTKEQFGQDGPISVHCSAGVGRTGVFITLSIVLERMRYEGVVDIFQTVKMLRTQRPAMVQTEDEYQFCYQAALEYLGSFDHYAT